MLGPVLEKLAREYAGKFLLAKVDTDNESELALQFGVRSIPAVFGVRDGKAVDGFVGVQPESVIRAWIDRLLADAGRNACRRGPLAGTIRPASRRGEIHRGTVAIDPDRRHRSAWRESPWTRVGSRTRRRGLSSSSGKGFLEPEAEKIKAELTLRLQAGQAGGVEAARAALAANPDDPNLKFQLAEALAAAGQYADALALCLELVERDRKGIGEKARQTMVAIFQLLPADSELVTEYQRQLSLALMD